MAPPYCAGRRPALDTLGRMDERVLAERLITYDTVDAATACARPRASSRAGWSRASSRSTSLDHDGLPVVMADVGRARLQDPPTVILHGHLDVVPAHAGQFEPRVEGDRLIGRGAYDMKGALAAMMCALKDVADQRRTSACASSASPTRSPRTSRSRSTDVLVAERLRGDFALTGEPTDLHIGVQAKGVLAVRVVVSGVAAHGSTPWLGDNAILKAHDAFRRIETLPFSRESSDLFDRPSINLARIEGGDAFNKVPDRCTMDVDIRYLPNQDPGEILAQIRAIPDLEIAQVLHARARRRLAPQPVRARAARRARPLDRGRGAVDRARRRVGRDLVPGGRHPRRRVRPGRRRPPRPRGVGLDRLAAPLPPGARATSSRCCRPGWSARATDGPDLRAVEGGLA